MKQQLHSELESQNLPQLRGYPVTGCTGLIKRDGWCFEYIDCHLWKLPHWKCDKCGDSWWSYFDEDNKDEGFDTESDDDEEEW